MALYALIWLIYRPSFNGLMKELLPLYLPIEASELSVGITYPAPVSVHALAVLGSIIGLSVFTVVAVRTFVAEETDSIPREFYTRRLVWATSNLVVGGFAFGVIVFIGLLLLIIPGFIAYVGLIFMTMFIAAEDESFLTALKRSWGLVRSDFLSVVILLVVLMIGIGILGSLMGLIIGFAVSLAGLSGMAGIVTGVVNAPATLFLLATLSVAFNQLRNEDNVDDPAIDQPDDGPTDATPISR